MKKLLFLGFLIPLSFAGRTQDWSTSGNAGTTDSNFLGTTDNRPVLIKVNNTTSGKVAPNGFVSLGYEASRLNTNATNTAIGHQAFYNITGGGIDWSTATGYQAGYSTTSGWNSSFFGYRAGYSNTTGRQNTAVGTLAMGGLDWNGMSTPVTGKNNTALGAWTLEQLTAGANNLAAGFGAGWKGLNSTIEADAISAIDSNCTFLGTYASRDFSISSTTSLKNATAIGFNAKVGASNSMVLGGMGIDAVNVGIGNMAPGNKLEITQGNPDHSGLRFTNLTAASAAAPSSGKVLSVNTNGDVVLETAASPTPADGSETKIIAGTNISVSGSGTVSDPYEIAATASSGSYWATTTLGNGNIINTNSGGVVIGQGILSVPTGYNLYVSGGILAEKVKVALKTSAHWADHVFAPNYRLRSLTEVEKYIREHRHLPNMPAAETLVREGGVEVTNMLARQMEKIEELTLYLIDLDKKMKKLEQENAALKSLLSHK